MSLVATFAEAITPLSSTTILVTLSCCIAVNTAGVNVSSRWRVNVRSYEIEERLSVEEHEYVILLVLGLLSA